MRWRTWTAAASMLLLAAATLPWLVVEAEATGCDRVLGGHERCIKQERRIGYAPFEADVRDTWQTPDGQQREEFRMPWADLAGPATRGLQAGGMLSLAAAALFPLVVLHAHRRPGRLNRRAAQALWVGMAGGITLFLLAALVHASRNDAVRGWPGWGMLLVAAALASGLSLRALPQPVAREGPMPSLPTF